MRKTELSEKERRDIAQLIKLHHATEKVSWTELSRRILQATGERVTGEALRQAAAGKVGVNLARVWRAYISREVAVADAFLEGVSFGQDDTRDPYPSRAQVIQLLSDKVSPNAIAYVRQMSLADGKDPGEAFWSEELAKAEKRRSEFEASLGSPPGRGATH